MTDRSLHISLWHLASRQSRRYWVPVSGYSWQSLGCCWPMVQVLVHWRILGISLYRSITAYSPIPFGNSNRLGDIEYLCENLRHWLTYLWQSHSFCWHMTEVLAHLWSASQSVGCWDMARMFVAKPQLLLAFDWSSGAPDRLDYISIWPIDHFIFANTCGNKFSLGDIGYLCQNMRHRITHSWQSRWFCWPMIEVPVHRTVLGISLWQIGRCIFAYPIWL